MTAQELHGGPRRTGLTMTPSRWQTALPMVARVRRSNDGLVFLLMAAALMVGLWFVPYAEVIVYPFRIFVTFIHEAAHALAAFITGGQVGHIHIAPDGNGLTYTRGGWGLLIASAGYPGAVLYGSGLLLVGKNARYVKPALAGTAVLVALVTLVLVRPILGFGFLAGVAITVVLAAVLYFATRRMAHFFLSFLGVQSCLNALFDLKTLFWLSAQTDMPTDAMNLEQATFIPAVVWALLWVIFSLVVLFFALRSYGSALR